MAKALVEQVFTRFGVPLSILSDQGTEVDGRIRNEVCRLFGIEKLRTIHSVQAFDESIFTAR